MLETHGSAKHICFVFFIDAPYLQFDFDGKVHLEIRADTPPARASNHGGVGQSSVKH